MVSTNFFISSVNVLFHRKHKNGITIEIFDEGGGLGLKNQCKTAFLGVKSFCQIALIMFRVFNGKIRGNCNFHSLWIIIFLHSTPIMREMCLKKLKKG